MGIDTGGSSAVDGYAYLAGLYCNTPYASPNNDWSRADFTGSTAVGCGIWFNNVEYSSDGANSAWAVLAAAYPTAIVRNVQVVMDETGTAYLDRIAIQNKMFVAKAKTATCPRRSAAERLITQRKGVGRPGREARPLP